MCGIAGVASLGCGLERADAETARAMADVIRHRGPDDEGVWHDEHVALAHRRLSILDLTAAGRQPMASPSGRYTVVFNGEIYNFGSLGKELERGGWRPSGRSDTEVLLAAVERWGLDTFLARADGMFAFVLYDRAARRVSLVRDRFGEKPLAYAVHHNRLYFASELRAFRVVPSIDLSLDADATGDYFRFGCVTGTSTIYSAIKRVPPATVIDFDLPCGMPRSRSYWDVTAADRATRLEGATDLLELLSAAVRDRLVSDRPVGTFLSGGIDSSLVSALAARHVSGSLKTFTVGWEDRELDESAQAARVAAALGALHHDVRLDRAHVVASVERLADVMDEPFGDSSQLAVLMVATAARSEVVVALTGDGGDELFAGYNRHRWLLRTAAVQRCIPGWARRSAGSIMHRSAPFVDLALRRVPVTRRPRYIADKTRKLAKAATAASLRDSYQALLAADLTIGREREFADVVTRALDSTNADDVLWALRVADVVGYLADDILPKVDRATMAVSLESRTPFLHPDVAAAALGMTAAELLSPFSGKRPLRSLLSHLLPSIDFSQSKNGFGIPVAQLLRCELRERLGDAVTTYVRRSTPVALDWASLLAALDAGSDEPAPLLWSLLTFELWASHVDHSVYW